MNEKQLANARTLARVLDSAVGIPGTNIRVGLDAVIGLIPGAGDVIGAGLSGYIVLAAVRAGAPTPVILRMLGNVLLDTAVGSIPVLGDLFDVAFRSNMRNAVLLERFAARPEPVVRRSKALVAGVVVALLLVLIGALTVAVLIARLFWQLLTG
ncbi:MAG: DUF4112 domain-containing protein [Gemmatimonadaceae bacterium]